MTDVDISKASANQAQRAADGSLIGILNDIEAEETLEYIIHWEKEHKKVIDHANALRKRAEDYEKRRLCVIEEKLFFHNERLKHYAAKQLEHKKERTLHLATGKLSFRKRQDRVEIVDEIALMKWAASNHMLDSIFEKKEVSVPQKNKIKAYIKKTGEIPEGTDINEQEDAFECETFK